MRALLILTISLAVSGAAVALGMGQIMDEGPFAQVHAPRAHVQHTTARSAEAAANRDQPTLG